MAPLTTDQQAIPCTQNWIEFPTGGELKPEVVANGELD
jgi:hypothetical protein